MARICDNRCGHSFFETGLVNVPEGYNPQPYYMTEALTELQLRCLDCVRMAQEQAKKDELSE
jgi:hypothetical protein